MIDIYAAMTSKQRISPSALPLGNSIYQQCDEVAQSTKQHSRYMFTVSTKKSGLWLACLRYTILHNVLLFTCYMSIVAQSRDSFTKHCTRWCAGSVINPVKRKITVINLDNKSARFDLRHISTLAQTFAGAQVACMSR